MLSVCLVKIIFANLFYYSAYFLYYLWVPLYYFSQLLPLCTILLVKSFQFQQNKQVLNRSLVIKTKFQQYVNWINVTGVIFTTKKQILNYFFVIGDASICNIYVVKFIVSLCQIRKSLGLFVPRIPNNCKAQKFIALKWLLGKKKIRKAYKSQTLDFQDRARKAFWYIEEWWDRTLTWNF